MHEFNEKVVLITGAAGTIGREACRRFKEEGALLVLVDKDSEKLEELKSYIGEDEDTLFLVADCTDEAQVQRYVQITTELFGSIDAFVHCVGITGKVGLIPTLETEDFIEIYKTNVISAFLNHKYIYPVMEKQKYGSIIFISALYGLYSAPHLACYTFANHALLGFMKSAALEAALSGVRVNAILPAPTESPVMYEFEKTLFPSNPKIGKQQILNFLPLARYVKPDEIAESILFYSSSKASYLHGESHIIDGGYTIK